MNYAYSDVTFLDRDVMQHAHLRNYKIQQNEQE